MPREGAVTYTTKDTIPPSSALTPTVTSVGTFFTLSVADASVKQGAVLFVAAQNSTRRIVNMRNALEGDLDFAFGSDLTAATARIVPVESAKLLMWSATPPATKSIIYNGVTITADKTVTKEASQVDQSTGSEFLEIPVIDGTTDNPDVIWTLF